MQLNTYGQFAHDQWLALADAYPHITLGEFVIMPNHMHGVVYIGERGVGNMADDAVGGMVDDAVAGGTADDAVGGAADDMADDTARDMVGDVADNMADGAVGGTAGGGKPLPCRVAPSLSDIIGAYKSLTYRDCLAVANAKNERLGKLWHRSYHENIIRTPEASRRIRQYIRNNVQTWARDKFHGG